MRNKSPNRRLNRKIHEYPKSRRQAGMGKLPTLPSTKPPAKPLLRP